LMGGGDKIVPAPLLAELIRCGATVRKVQIPSAAAESRYRPSAKLEEFIRVRDVTCRFPGCEEPAERCDIDHTIPYPVGPTHPSNLKALCRKHHLLKTFWTGAGGWHEEQLPDGTVVWTAPTGRTYKTLPGSRVFFPRWDTTTAPLPKRTGSVVPLSYRTLMMPKRRRTRAAEQARRIQEERELNAAERAARNKPPPPPPERGIDTSSRDDDDPPPF
ncbi:MAG TPA: HNH endonuclease signature motif containing protein, partial [Mycobacterium sp.]|nr:HNH endonuclease signature motif containing protein [Mycobacterium sp.]